MKFKLDFEIELTPGIAVTHLNVTGGKAYDLDQLNGMLTANNIIIGSIEIDIIDENITILLLFVGKPNLSAKFNFSLNNQNLFREKEVFVLPPNGKGQYKSDIKLPL